MKYSWTTTVLKKSDKKTKFQSYLNFTWNIYAYYLYISPYKYIACTQMQRDLAATDTFPTSSGWNPGFLIYFPIFARAESEILSLSYSISSFKNDGFPVTK